MLDRRDVVRNLGHVVEFDRRRLVIFEQQEVRQRGLRALDLRGQEGFLADVHVEKQGRRGQDRGYTIEAPDRGDGAFVDAHEPPKLERRLRRQRGGHIGAHALACGTRLDIGAEPLILPVRHTRSFN